MILSHEDFISLDDGLTEEQVKKNVIPISLDYMKCKEEFKKKGTDSSYVLLEFKRLSFQFLSIFDEHLYQFLPRNDDTYPLLGLYSEIDRFGILKVMIKRLLIRHQEFKVIITDILHWLEQNLIYLLRHISDIEFKFNDIDKDSGILMDWESIQDEF